MDKNTEWSRMQRELSKRRCAEEIDQTAANKMVYEACLEAFAKLDAVEQYEVKKAVDKLTKKVKGLGERGALELLASLSFHFEEGSKTIGYRRARGG